MGKKIKVKVTLEETPRPRGGVEVQLYSFFNFGARFGGWSTSHPGRFTTGKDPVHIVQEAM